MSFFGPGSFGGGFSKSPFRLANISGLKYWLDAQDSGSYTLTGSDLSEYRDKSGNGYDSTDDASRRPTYSATALNGKPGFTFASGDRINLTGITNDASNYTAFVVASPSTVGSQQFFFDSLTGRFVIAHTTSAAGGLTGYYDGAYDSFTRAHDGPQILTYKLDSTNGAIGRRNGVQIGTGTYTQTAIGGAVSIGSSYDGAGNYFVGAIGELILFNRALTAAEIEQVERYLANRWAIPHPATANNIIVCDGDSLTLGHYISGGVLAGTQSYPGQLAALYDSPDYLVINDGVSSAQLTAMDSAASTGIDALAYNASATVTLVAWGGTNDLVSGAQTAAQAYARLRTYIQNRAATGKYDHILVVTAIPRADTATTTEMFDYNTLIRDNWAELQGDGADALVDTATNSAFNADGDYNSATYYDADKVHLKAAGYAEIADMVHTAIEGL